MPISSRLPPASSSLPPRRQAPGYVQAIKEYHELTGIKVGFKPAGGINCVNDALIYYTIVKEVLGEEWLNNELFRLGTSRLANLLLSEIKGRGK